MAKSIVARPPIPAPKPVTTILRPKRKRARAIAAPITVNGIDILPLQQAARLLHLVGEVGEAAELGPDGAQLMEVIGVTRLLIEGVFDKLAASLHQGGAV